MFNVLSFDTSEKLQMTIIIDYREKSVKLSLKLLLSLS